MAEANRDNNAEVQAEAGIIVVSHADYGSSMLRTAEFILGPLSDCTSISVDVGQEVPETVRRLKDAAERLDKGAGVIVLTDMFGGTPTNLALSLLATHRVSFVWVKGHDGHPENERCDQLATTEADKYKPAFPEGEAAGEGEETK